MRLTRSLALLLVAVLLLAALPTQPASASSQPASNHTTSNFQTLGKCANVDFLTAVGKDLVDFGTAMKGLDVKDPAGAATLLLQTAVLRQKYEDMDADPNCIVAQVAMIAGIANYSDVIGLVLAIKADPNNAKLYADAITPQVQRAGKILVLVQQDIAGQGNATAEASEPLTSGQCTDTDFRQTVGKDLVDFGAALKALDSKDTAAVAKMFLSISVLRQKYEDLSSTPRTCFIARLATIIAYANYGDLISLILASKADPLNEKVYTDALQPQVDRAQKFLKVIQSEMGMDTAATPEATAAQ